MEKEKISMRAVVKAYKQLVLIGQARTFGGHPQPNPPRNFAGKNVQANGGNKALDNQRIRQNTCA